MSRHIFKFVISEPFLVDGKVLILNRYTVDDNGRPVKGEVFTVDGWYEYHDFEGIDITKLPTITGIELHDEAKIEKRLAEFEAMIREAIK